MAESNYQFRRLARAIDEVGQVQQDIERPNYAGLRYSSPKPWILALGLSLGLWIALACVLWAFFG
jgi:hypothetical protein